ncbi:MAG: hypothetical protein ACI4RN_00110 [Oscillospiraceae bacterium]
MKKLIENYEQTLKELEKRINQLKPELKAETDIDKRHKLEWRIDMLREETYEMRSMLIAMKEHISPKAPSPSIIKSFSGDEAA